MTSARSSYDDVVYESHVLFYTNPACLAATGRLYGLQPPAVERCRVLELGCATAGNLLSLAVTLPHASFVGVDSSARQIREGLDHAKALGLTNIALHQCDILDVGKDFGTFDYIICHGVYSWVPSTVADQILSICARRLSPQGIAYVSYNTYPGWHIKAMIRDMMLYHVRQVNEPLQRVREARTFLHVLARSVGDQEDLYKRLLAQQAEDLEQGEDAYVFHEFLEDVNTPVYFHEFTARAAANGLQYLGPARFSSWEQALSPEIHEALSSVPRLVREQYLDFLGNRTFRRSLLCHAAAPVAAAPQAEAVRDLYLMAEVSPLSETPDVTSSAVEEFRAGAEGVVSTNHPLAKAILTVLAEAHPLAVPFGSLRSLVQDRLAIAHDPSKSEHILMEAVLHCAQANLLELRSAPPSFAAEISERPLASPLARLQAQGPGLIGNLRHRLVEVADLDRIVLRYLDGAHDLTALHHEATKAIAAGEIELQDAAAVPIRDPAAIAEAMDAALGPALERLKNQALLLA
jgi:methyltransferase-like protein/2-polyprenyl-3-methyl-5-hydroxy-6-metoxy-1,4-benzoquinol methylase